MVSRSEGQSTSRATPARHPGCERRTPVTDHARTVAIVAGSEPPVVSVAWFAPVGPSDSGYSVILSDVDPNDDDSSDSELVCLHCLVDDQPEVGVALDLAREHGQVDLDENGEWVMVDLSQLDPPPEAGRPKATWRIAVGASPPANCKDRREGMASH